MCILYSISVEDEFHFCCVVFLYDDYHNPSLDISNRNCHDFNYMYSYDTQKLEFLVKRQ